MWPALQHCSAEFSAQPHALPLHLLPGLHHFHLEVFSCCANLSPCLIARLAYSSLPFSQDRSPAGLLLGIDRRASPSQGIIIDVCLSSRIGLCLFRRFACPFRPGLAFGQNFLEGPEEIEFQKKIEKKYQEYCGHRLYD